MNMPIDVFWNARIALGDEGGGWLLGGKTLKGTQEVRGTSALIRPNGDRRMIQRLNKIHHVPRDYAHHCAPVGIKTHSAASR